MKKKLGLRSIFVLLFCFGFLFAGNIKAEAAQTVTKGSYTYFAEDGTIYKMNSKSGKISKVKRLKQSNTVEVVAVKDSWLYLTVDDYFCMRGTDNSWMYVYRIKTNGKSLQNLGKGRNPVVYGKYIYYERLDFKRKPGEPSGYAKAKGIYRMKLNGSDKRRLCVPNSCSWIRIYNKRIYFSDFLNDRWGIYSVNLSGKDFRAEIYGNVSKAAYFTNQKMYFTFNGNYGVNDLYVKDLRRGGLTKLRAGQMVAAYNGEIYYHTGNFGKQTLYRYRVSTGKTSKVCTRATINNAIGGKKWVIVNYYRGNKKKNTGVDRVRLNGASRKEVTKYFRS